MGRLSLSSALQDKGKSTLATHLCEAGWRLLSDETAPIRMDVDEVLPFPQSAVRRKYPGREFSEGEQGYLEKEEVPLTDTALHLKPAPIRAIVFPLFRDGTAPGARLTLSWNCRARSVAKLLQFRGPQGECGRADREVGRPLLRCIVCHTGLVKPAAKVLDALE
jgi:hypothetical protein